MNTTSPPIERTPLQAGLMFGALAVVTYLMLQALLWWQMPGPGASKGDGMNFDLWPSIWLLGKPAWFYWDANPEHLWRFEIEHGYRSANRIAIVINTVFWGLVVGVSAAIRRRKDIGRGVVPRPFWRTAAWTLAIAVAGFFVSFLLWIPFMLVPFFNS